MSNEIPTGYYRDASGELQRDRRRTSCDRRKSHGSAKDGERRDNLRRKTDREIQEREHHDMIADALEEFVADREG